MPDPQVPITPDTKVAELLESYPRLEEVLISLSPAFAKLRNPILRRTVARVATLDQAARIGGVEPRELVRRLREAAGMPVGDGHAPATGPSQSVAPGQAGLTSAPPWVGTAAAAATIDADEVLDRGEHPLGVVRRQLAGLGPGDVVALDSSFVPAPLIDALGKQGYDLATVAHAGRYRTYIRRAQS